MSKPIASTKRTKLSKFPDKLEIQSPIPSVKQIFTYASTRKLSLSGSESGGNNLSKWQSATKSSSISSSESVLEKNTSQESMFRKGGGGNKATSKWPNSPTKTAKSPSSPQKEKEDFPIVSVAASNDNIRKAVKHIVTPKTVSLSISTASSKPKIAIAPHSPKISPKSPTFITSATTAQPPALTSVFSSAQGHELSLPIIPENPDIFAFIKYLPPLSPSLKKPRFLLPKKTRATPSLTVVLDLDETLVHCNTLEGREASLSFPVMFNGIEYTITGNMRPHCKEFLEKCVDKFEIVLFTASQKIYADQLATIIDPQHILFKHRLFRDSCTFVSGNYLKDLDGLGRDLSRTVIVDNSPQAFGYHINNGIPIKSWYEDKSDNELLKVFTFLEHLDKLDDVRPHIKASFGLEDIIASS